MSWNVVAVAFWLGWILCTLEMPDKESRDRLPSELDGEGYPDTRHSIGHSCMQNMVPGTDVPGTTL